MDDKEYSLNFNKFKAEIDRNIKESKAFDDISEYKNSLSFSSLPYEKQLFEQDTILKSKRERWHKNLTRDVYVDEAVNVLNDMISPYGIKKVANIKN